MYVIKALPEDFQVDEIYDVALSDTGRYCYFELWKKNMNTLDAIKRISDKTNIPAKKFGFAGAKDRNAITTQLCSAPGVIRDFDSPRITVCVKGYAAEPYRLGDHLGNRFKIVVRNIETPPTVVSQFVNYFGEQRFSTHNVEIGKALVKKDYKHACDLIDHPTIKEGLHQSPTDYVGALRRLPVKLLTLFVHSVQSDMWNKGVKQWIAQGGTGSFPLFGFGTEIEDESKRKIVESIAEQEGVEERDFVSKAIPELSSEGGERSVYAEVEDLIIGELEDDELHAGKKKVTVMFRLGTGSYATEVLKQLFL